MRDRSDGGLQTLLALEGPGLARKVSIVGSAPDGTLVKRNMVTVSGDTVLVESETTKVHVGLFTRMTTREYLTSDHAELVAETTTVFPARDRQFANTLVPVKRRLVFDKTE